MYKISLITNKDIIVILSWNNLTRKIFHMHVSSLLLIRYCNNKCRFKATSIEVRFTLSCCLLAASFKDALLYCKRSTSFAGFHG